MGLAVILAVVILVLGLAVAILWAGVMGIMHLARFIRYNLNN